MKVKWVRQPDGSYRSGDATIKRDGEMWRWSFGGACGYEDLFRDAKAACANRIVRQYRRDHPPTAREVIAIMLAEGIPRANIFRARSLLYEALRKWQTEWAIPPEVEKQLIEWWQAEMA